MPEYFTGARSILGDLGLDFSAPGGTAAVTGWVDGNWLWIFARGTMLLIFRPDKTANQRGDFMTVERKEPVDPNEKRNYEPGVVKRAANAPAHVGQKLFDPSVVGKRPAGAPAPAPVPVPGIANVPPQKAANYEDLEQESKSVPVMPAPTGAGPAPAAAPAKK